MIGQVFGWGVESHVFAFAFGCCARCGKLAEQVRTTDKGVGAEVGTGLVAATVEYCVSAWDVRSAT